MCRTSDQCQFNIGTMNKFGLGRRCSFIVRVKSYLNNNVQIFRTAVKIIYLEKSMCERMVSIFRFDKELDCLLN